MVLTAMPCNDDHSVGTNFVTVELSEHSSNFTNDMDLCSPFCFCDCCQTLSFPTSFYFLTINLVKTLSNNTSKVFLFSSPIVSIWQPPQI